MDKTEVNHLFLDAAQRGDKASLIRCKGQGADLDAVDNLGYSAIHLAALHNIRTDVVEQLLDWTPDLINEPCKRVDAGFDSPPDTGNLPLHLVAYNTTIGAIPIARLLLARGAEANAQNKLGQTALHLCAKNARFSESYLGLVHAYRYLRDDERLPHMQRWVDTAIGNSSKESRELCRLLLEAGASLTILDNQNRLPIDIACEYLHPEAVRLFIEHHSPVDQIDIGGASEWCADKTRMYTSPLRSGEIAQMIAPAKEQPSRLGRGVRTAAKIVAPLAGLLALGRLSQCGGPPQPEAPPAHHTQKPSQPAENVSEIPIHRPPYTSERPDSTVTAPGDESSHFQDSVTSSRTSPGTGYRSS